MQVFLCLKRQNFNDRLDRAAHSEAPPAMESGVAVVVIVAGPPNKRPRAVSVRRGARTDGLGLRAEEGTARSLNNGIDPRCVPRRRTGSLSSSTTTVAFRNSTTASELVKVFHSPTEVKNDIETSTTKSKGALIFTAVTASASIVCTGNVCWHVKRKGTIIHQARVWSSMKTVGRLPRALSSASTRAADTGRATPGRLGNRPPVLFSRPPRCAGGLFFEAPVFRTRAFASFRLTVFAPRLSSPSNSWSVSISRRCRGSPAACAFARPVHPPHNKVFLTQDGVRKAKPEVMKSFPDVPARLSQINKLHHSNGRAVCSNAEQFVRL